VFGYFIVTLLLLSIITGGFIADRIDLLENSVDRGYFEEYQELELGSRHFYHNGSFFHFEEVESDGQFQYELSRLDENLTQGSPLLTLPSTDRLNGSSNSDEIVRSNGFIHILSWVPRSSSDDENRSYCQYTMVSIETSEVTINNFSIDRIHYHYHNRIVASGPDANIVYSRSNRNATSGIVESLVVIRYFFDNGHRSVSNQTLINMSFSSHIPFWNHRSFHLRFVPGNESVSILIEASDLDQFHENGTSYFGTREWDYFTRIAYNGSVLRPLALIANSTSVPSQYQHVIDSTNIAYLSGFGDHVIYRRSIANEFHYLVEYVMFRINENGSIEETILSFDDQKKPTYYGSSGWYAGRYGETDAHGITFLPVINSEKSNGTLNLTLEYFTIDQSGMIVENEKYSLSKMSAFAFSEDLSLRSEYDGLYFLFFIEQMIRTDHSKIVTMECWLSEGNSLRDEGTGTQFRYLVTIENGELTFIEYGPEIEDDDTRGCLNASIVIGILTGLVVPITFWWLLKRKSV